MPTTTSLWWCFTLNNPTEEDAERYKAFAEHANVRYLCYGREHWHDVAKTPHYQGYLELYRPQRFSWIKKRLPKAHWTDQHRYKYSTRTQARNYCFKECKDPVEYGVFKKQQGKRNDLDRIKAKIAEGATNLDIANAHFGTWCRYNKAFDRYRLLKTKYDRTIKTVYWFWGPSGAGKSTAIDELVPRETYWKTGSSKWFDGYDGEKAVVFDDFRGSNASGDISFSYLLRLLDRFPVMVEVKGGTMSWLPDTIVISAPCHPRDCYDVDEDMYQLVRRCTEIREFKRR